MENLLLKKLKEYKTPPVKDIEGEAKKNTELQLHFYEKIQKNNGGKIKNNLSIINFVDIFIVEYLQVFDLVEEGYDYFILKGSRFSGKSTFIVQFIILDMIINPQHSWMCAMMNKIDHSDSTMAEFETWINNIDTIWHGFKNCWEKKDGQSIKEWRFKFNGNYQKVKFVGIDELAARTINPPAKNIWRGLFVEELQSAKEKAGMDPDKKEEKMQALKTFEGTAVRFFQQLTQEQQDKLNFLQFFALNPYNGEDKGLKEFNEYAPDDKVKLETYGFDLVKVPELKKVFITSNFRVNNFLPRQALEFMEKIYKIGGEDVKVLVNGMTGNPVNTIYKNILPFIDKNKGKIPECSTKGYAGFKKFMIVLDVGNGGDGEMVVGLIGQKTTGSWVPLDRWGSKKWVQRNEFDVSKIMVELVNQIKKWEEYYNQFSSVGIIPIIIDYDIYFQKLFYEAFERLEWRTEFNLQLFDKKYLSVWKNEARPPVIKYLITTGRLEIYEQLWPEIVSQIRTTKAKENGTIIGGNDDHRQALEMGLFAIAEEWLKEKGSMGELFDKELLAFYKQIKR